MHLTNPFRPGSWAREQIETVHRGWVAAVLAIGLWTLIYGVLQIALAFELKHMSARFSQLADDLDLRFSRQSRERETAATS